MAHTNPNNPNCANCNKDGLAILPVRYAVVPNNVAATVPAPLGNRVSNTALSQHNYALRTLRQGFFYVYYEKHPRGSQYKWEVYSVTPQGTLWKQAATTAISIMAAEPTCARMGHNLPASIIHIEKPEKQGKVWLAFSEHAWSQDSFAEFEKNEALRDRRMQTLLPAKWVAAGGYKHGLVATQANIETVIEYQDNFVESQLTGGTLRGASNPDGTHVVSRLEKRSTCHPLHMRKGQSEKVAAVMKKTGENPKGKDHTPLLMAVWDAVGITTELNGFRNDAAGVIEQYGKERELEITTLNAINGVKKMLADQAEQHSTDMQKQVADSQNWYSADAVQKMRKNAQTLVEPERSRTLGYCDDLDFLGANKLPQRFNTKRTQAHSVLLHGASPDYEQQRKLVMDEARAYQQKMPQMAQRNKVQVRAHSWAKYEAKLEGGGATYKKFQSNYDVFLSAADTLVDQRTDDLIAWLESKLLIDAFTEFHPKNVDDGVMFDDQVGTAIHGMNSSIKGQAKIDAWVKEMKATETNLLWRAIALNQEEGVKEVNAAMATAAATTAPVGQLAVEFLSKHVRKWADLYKKANTLQNTLVKAGDAAERIKLVKVTSFDRLFMTVGDRLFKPFLQRGVDTGAEFAVRGLMLARAGVEPDRILDALRVQAKQEGLARAAIVRRLQAAKTFIGSGQDFKDAKHAELQKKWQDLKANPTKGVTALKENRLSLIVATLEIINLTKIGWEFGHDKAKLGELAAAAATATAAVMDIAANAAKHLVGDKVSVTFQMLKVSGGVLSAGAGYYSMVLDWDKAGKLENRERYALANAYKLKATLQMLSTTLGLLGSISYATPLMEASGRKAVQAIGTRLLFYRLFCMTWAVRINMVGLAITFAIWAFTDDALEEWCEECAFGSKKHVGSKDPQKVMNALAEALQEVI